MFSSGGMGLFFNGAENWGLAFGTWPAAAVSDNSSSSSLLLYIHHPVSQSVTAQQTVNPRCQCARTWIVWTSLPRCPGVWTGIERMMHGLGGEKLHSSPASCPLLADPSPSPAPAPAPAPLLCLPALHSCWPEQGRAEQSRAEQSEPGPLHTQVVPERGEGGWAGWRGPLLP